MVEKTTLFRSDLFYLSDIGSEQQRKELIKELHQVQKKNPDGVGLSNHGCWRAETPCKDISWLIPDINKLLKEAVDFYSKDDPVFAQVLAYKNIKFNYWANINEPGSRNSVHCHKQSHFSAVYYLQATDTGPIRFINPANIYSDCSSTSAFVRNFEFTARDGDLILWPAWMPHEVETNHSSKERINLVFDIRLVP